MRIDLAGWSSRGVRAPDADIDLTRTDGSAASVALVQMPNGTGKTTTLELLKAALSHSARDWTPDQVRRFRRRRDTQREGRFIARLLVDGRPLTFELTLDFENGEARYRTTKVGSGGIVSGWDPPPEVHRFLSPEFLRLFVFDGEFADDLFDPEKAEADRAIDALCQLYLLDDIGDFAEEEWNRRSRAAGSKSTRALESYRSQQLALLKRRDELRTMEARAEREVATHGAAIADLEAKISERLSTMKSTQADHAAALQQLGTARQNVSMAAGAAMAAIRMPLSIDRAFARSLTQLKEHLDHLRLPENTSAQFFEELILEPECICGREMTPGARTEITTRAKRYLDADESGTINAMKSDIDKFAAKEDGKTADEKLARELQALAEARRSEHKAEQQVRILKQKLIDEGDEQLKAWEKALDRHRSQFVEYQNILDSIRADGDPDDTPIFSLKLIDKKLREIGGKIAELTETVTLRRQTNILKEMLAKAAGLARSRIKDELVVEANERLKGILVNDPVEIARIERSLRLSEQEGASVGQTLSVGYTFLMSVLNRGHNNFPLVVDSPANPIDRDVRHSIGELIPQLCTQFVGLTINTEREGFVPALERMSSDIKFLTLFRKTEGTRRLMSGLPGDGVTETETGVLIEGRDYFMRFGVRSEEEA